jgi:Photoprotection regulator fluorescence recovery protein
MQANTTEWSIAEQTVAKAAFDKAYDREINALIEEIRHQSGAIGVIEDVWSLHDFLSAKRHEIDGKYDYNYPMLLFTFAGLVKDGWLQLDELKSLSQDKLAKISALTRL